MSKKSLAMKGVSFVSAALLILAAQAHGAGTRGGSTATIETPSNSKNETTLDLAFPTLDPGSQLHRELGDIKDFQTLECNKHLDEAPCANWTDTFGRRVVHEHQVVIPCGKCVQMDHAGPILKLKQGMDIRGKLVFPPDRSSLPNSDLTVRSPFIFVQGVLEMNTADKPVDGNFVYKFEMVDESDYYLEPVDSNEKACPASGCKVGKKVIVVAGGKVDIHGIPAAAPTWLNLYDAFSTLPDTDTVNTLVVEDSVKDHWAPGAEILITSHTLHWKQQQEQTIADIRECKEDGYVEILLNSSIARPTTLKESRDFAVEVALLSRNIVFEGGPDPTEYHGGQFIVYHTPNVAQTLEGVEIKNFGQQGYLGRYPIHFHFCRKVDGTLVSKNTVRQSNQRCVVVHGTDNMVIKENIAFDTAGHCFLLEDGIETGNEFIRNLGAKNGPPKRKIPNMGTNGKESDGKTSTFWVTNPSNTFIGNVAAGASDSGYWFEMKIRGDRAKQFPGLDPRREPLTKFENNVAHSNGKIGFRAYPSGYRPEKVAEIKGFKAYRNTKGAFLHLSKNIDFVGGLFADNREGLEIDRADNINVQDVVFVGYSQSLRDLIARQGRRTCQKGRVVGLEHHTWKNEVRNKGSTMTNLTFSGFKDTECPIEQAIRVDDRIQTPRFDLYTTFENVKFEPDEEKINFCDANAAGITAFFTDVDGSFDPSGSSQSHSPATLLSNVPSMMKFVHKKKCTTVEKSCYSYCRDTSFRGVRFDVDSAGTKNYSLRVCSKAFQKTCVHFPGYLRGKDPTLSTRTRKFNAYLPKGEYTATFIDRKGKRVWPSFVHQKYQMNQLGPDDSAYLQEGDVELITPEVSVEECSQLVRNGDLSRGGAYWLHRFGGVELAQNGGMYGLDALTSRKPARSNIIVQYLDTRCMQLMVGETYEISVRFRLMDKYKKVYRCNPKLEKCPDAGIFGSWGRSSFASTMPLDAENDPAFQLLGGTFQVRERMASEQQVGLFIRSNIDQGLSWFIDYVSVRLVQEETMEPSAAPSQSPSAAPTLLTSPLLRVEAFLEPSTQPSSEPSTQPSSEPSTQPSTEPTTPQPSRSPTREPSIAPTFQRGTLADLIPREYFPWWW